MKNLTPTLNKETKNKTSVLTMQLTTEQRVFVVKTFYKTSSYPKVKEVFYGRFLEKDPPTNGTIWKNVVKYKTRKKFKYQQGKIRQEENIEDQRNNRTC